MHGLRFASNLHISMCADRRSDMLEFIASKRSVLPTPLPAILQRIFDIPLSVEQADQRFNFFKELVLPVETRAFVFTVRSIDHALRVCACVCVL